VTRDGAKFACVLLAASCAAAPIDAPAAAPTPTVKRLTLERIFAEPDLSGSTGAGATWLPDGSGYVFVDHGSIVRVDAATAERSTWVDADAYAKAFAHATNGEKRPSGRPGFGGFSFFPRERGLLVQNGGACWIYEFSTKIARRVTEPGEVERDATISPDGRQVAYVHGYDVRTFDETGETKQWTTGGTVEHTHGVSDWVYDEELDVHSGLWWSPDSRWIAYLDIDETSVPRIPIVDFLPTHPTVEWERYPKAGDSNPVVRLGVAFGHGEPIRVDLPGASDGYVARVRWAPDGESLLVEVLNRRQDKVSVLKCDARQGTSSTLFEETSPSWVDVNDDLRVLRDGRLLWKSARTGFAHLYVVSADGASASPVTSGAWNVDGVVGLDEDAGFVYFVGGAAGPRETNLYRVHLDGSGLERLTPDVGVHSISMSPDAKSFLDTWSDGSRPARRDLRRADGSLVATVDPNPCEELSTFRRATTEFVEIPTTDGVVLQAQWIRPADFDPTKRYPVLMSVYGGPLSRHVSASWDGRTRLWHEMLADQGLLVLCVDNRAAAPHGIGVAGTIYGRLGEVELADQLAAVNYMKTLPYVDGARIGIWGWSYGGYMAAYSILNAPDAFHAAAAVAPVTDWRDYDTIYTERYMGLPKDNVEGYKKSAPVSAAANLRGELLLVHGTSDDNVHMQNTMQLVDALERAGKRFRFVAYPGKRHGIGGTETRRHVFATLTEFLMQALDVAPPRP
jgi:dipeptidyl-peptidase-4